MDKLKLYCYADETGPDTKGKLFLVAVVITTGELREAIERGLEELEERSGKGILKWRLTSISKKQSYLNGILRIGALQGSLFYTLYKDTKDYLKLVAKTLAKAIIAFSQNRDYQATIYIDGLRKTEIKEVVRFLSAESIKRRKVKGLRDESSAYIRLADALAGFFRDYEEGESYTKELFQLFKARNFVKKLQ
ncbi:MAG: DUF3800 domain-containing protein [Candidatus Poribacteria bacterium]